ncbi:hypothetical protein QL285_066698 [Trifolium repens]|nr:hypothetical protein QL285_066698 [Trifolium repens]
MGWQQPTKDSISHRKTPQENEGSKIRKGCLQQWFEDTWTIGKDDKRREKPSGMNNCDQVNQSAKSSQKNKFFLRTKSAKQKDMHRLQEFKEDGQCFKLEQRSTRERHANLSSVMEEMPQANERLNKRCLGGNPKRWKHVWTTLSSLIGNRNQFQQAEFFKMFLSRLLQQNDLLVALKKIEVKHNGLIRSRLLEEIINSAISHQMEELVLHVFLHNDKKMDQIFNKVGTYWFNQKANNQLNSVGDDLNSFSESIEGGTKWLVNKIKGKMQKPLPELLKEYDLPIGIFPRDATNYEFNEETGKLVVFVPQICEVGYKDSSVLRFFTTVTGYLEKGKLADIEGMKTKVIIWVKVTTIFSEGSKLYVTAGMKKTRSREAYDVTRDGVLVDKF